MQAGTLQRMGFVAAGLFSKAKPGPENRQQAVADAAF